MIDCSLLGSFKIRLNEGNCILSSKAVLLDNVGSRYFLEFFRIFKLALLVHMYIATFYF